MTTLRLLTAVWLLCALPATATIAATLMTCRGEYAAAVTQTAVETATHRIDEDGIPVLRIAEVGEVHHPAWIALYGLAYAGREQYDPALALAPDEARFWAVARWLETHLEPAAGGGAWPYRFDSSYNDVHVRAPWISAFAQATGIQVFVEAFRRSNDKRWMRLARRAAAPLLNPLDRGGLQFRDGDDVWLEEIPAPCNNPSHILNGHMRAAIALWELADAGRDRAIERAARDATATLLRWLPRYDAGYWLRYDLNPRKRDLLFRIVNPYGGHTNATAIGRIALSDPELNASVAVDVGSDGDASGPHRIGGIGWSQPERVEGRVARRLVENSDATHAYAYLELPAAWSSTLRREPLVLEVDYFDARQTHLIMQHRSIAPGLEFRDLRNGDLLLTGKQAWRTWRVELRAEDLGQPVGVFYAAKHAEYLEKLRSREPGLDRWARIAEGYGRSAEPFNASRGTRVEAKEPVSPRNTPVVPVMSVDEAGVVQQHFADAQTRWLPDGSFDPAGGTGLPVYSPYLIASQLLEPRQLEASMPSARLRREPALAWLLSEKNFDRIGDAVVYPYRFPNVYNDVKTSEPWPSAFGQAYVLKALAASAGLGHHVDPTFQRAVVRGFAVPVDKGGMRSAHAEGTIFYEEVPNATHVLNAHLVATAELLATPFVANDSGLRELAENGVASLRHWMHLFDAGYWLRYDLNPRKELLFQISTLESGVAPLIDKVYLENTRSGTYVELDLGEKSDATGAARFSGVDWTEVKQVEGVTVRSFREGRELRGSPVVDGAVENVFLSLPLPDSKFDDFFDVPEHRLVIRYRDVGEGVYALKLRSIREGDKLAFVPLRGGILRGEGDGEWKQFSVMLRPQDLGWYKGADYQRFEVEQLMRIAEATGDWSLQQMAERQAHFLNEFTQPEQKIEAVVPPLATSEPLKLRVIRASPVYPGHGFDNSLDGESQDNYTAAVEGQAKYFVDLQLESRSQLRQLRLVWESAENHAGQVDVYEIDEDGAELRHLQQVKIFDGSDVGIPLTSGSPVQRIRISFDRFFGQERALLRQIELR